MDSVLLVNAIMDRYAVDVQYVAKLGAASLRGLLLPILHRWGVGMCRHPIGDGSYFGGTLIYPRGNLSLNPEVKGYEAGTDTNTVYVGREVGALDALDLLHPELSRALWTEVTVPIYNGDRTQVLDKSTRLLDYIEDIPLPPPHWQYVWITEAEDGEVSTISASLSRDNDEEHYMYLSPRTTYYGPVAYEYLDDITGHVEERQLLSRLPRYSFGTDHHIQ